MPISAGGGGLVKIASGSLTDIKSTTPKTIDFRNWPALANFGEIRVRIDNVRRSTGTTARDLRMTFMIAGAAQASAYSGSATGANQAFITLFTGLFTFLNGYAEINLSKFFVNDTPCHMVTGALIAVASATGLVDNGGRGVSGIHDGLSFTTPDALTAFAFDYTIFGVQK